MTARDGDHRIEGVVRDHPAQPFGDDRSHEQASGSTEIPLTFSVKGAVQPRPVIVNQIQMRSWGEYG